RLCQSVGIPALALKIESFEDYLDVLKLFTLITENPQGYEIYGERVKENADEYRRLLFDTSVLFIRAGSSKSSTKAKNGEQHFAAAMLKELGTHNVAENSPVLLDGISFEEILRENPERIFISLMGDEDAAFSNVNSLLKTPEWSALSAVQNNKVYILPKSLFQYKPNARWADAYRYLAECLSEE
ncbi:MAG: ABC transporter substrate-binding protein, partial [Clostridia bacterium]|nr:ABC transporter substrate-binding protein [Clostridia bacterium]